MKIDFAIGDSSKESLFCIKCHSTDIKPIKSKAITGYKCNACDSFEPRAIIIDPKIEWWIDDRTKDYWHKSVGVFIFNSKNEFLIFELNKFPFASTIPAGHLDKNELPEVAVIREAFEETNLSLTSVKLLAEERISNDQCRRGSDHHFWYIFTAKLPEEQNIRVNEEGQEPRWVTAEQAKKMKLTYPVKLLVEKYFDQLISPK